MPSSVQIGLPPQHFNYSLVFSIMTLFILLSLVAIAYSQPPDVCIHGLADAAYQELSGSKTLPCDDKILLGDQCAYNKVDAATTYVEALQIQERQESIRARRSEERRENTNKRRERIREEEG